MTETMSLKIESKSYTQFHTYMSEWLRIQSCLLIDFTAYNPTDELSFLGSIS